jgi:hypothetical protein
MQSGDAKRFTTTEVAKFQNVQGYRPLRMVRETEFTFCSVSSDTNIHLNS